jgi:uncharacterized protein YdbL (DUF1318 family)
MKKSFLAVAALGMLIATSAFALDLHQARGAGQVGEKADGYVTALAPSAEVNALVSEVNAKRQKEYTRISQQNGQSVAVVGKLAAAEIISGLESGNRYQDANGSWKTR